jgi:hypothetical protein
MPRWQLQRLRRGTARNPVEIWLAPPALHFGESRLRVLPVHRWDPLDELF